jgi:hypothetical protein
VHVALGKPEYFRLSYSFLFKIQLVRESTDDRFELSIGQEKTLGFLIEMMDQHLNTDPFISRILLKTENGWHDFSGATMTIAQLAKQLDGNLVLSFKIETIELIDLDDLSDFSFDLDDFSSSKKRCFGDSCNSIEGSIALFLCGNCKNAIYCSRSCQKSHWEKEHKTKCIQSSFSSSSSSFSSSSSSSSGTGTQGVFREIKTKGF